MEDICKEALRTWEDIVTQVGEDLYIDYDVIDIFKTHKDIQCYVILAVREYFPLLEDLIIVSALCCSDYIKSGKLGKIALIWFCNEIRDQLLKKLILLDKESYSYVEDISEENYNCLTNVKQILKLLSSENYTRKAYKKTKTKTNILKTYLQNKKNIVKSS